MVQAAGHDVVENGHAFEQSDVLERASDALTRDLIGFQLRARFAFVQNLTLLRDVKARNDVQHRRFPGAVRADDGANFAFADVKRDVLDRHNAAKAQGDVFHLHHNAANLAPVCGGVAFVGIVQHIPTPYSAAIGLVVIGAMAASRSSSVAEI